MAAAFGLGGYTKGVGLFEDTPPTNSPNSDFAIRSSGNSYAAELSQNVISFNNMSKDNFTNISHNPPFSFGMMARKNFEKNGIETGLVYTHLASRFDFWNYNVHQRLHYIGLPVNLLGYFENSKPDAWRVYLSAGFMVEKGLRAIYSQELRWVNQIQNTVVKSNINGLQWSLNGGLGVSRRLEKGFGVYFESRVGYSLDNNQPVSIRTEMPVYVGLSFGLNYEL